MGLTDASIRSTSTPALAPPFEYFQAFHQALLTSLRIAEVDKSMIVSYVALATARMSAVCYR